MNNKVKIKEIFTSIQGEGPYIGVKQLFIRFCGCNLSCEYCDTDYDGGNVYTVEELLAEVNKHSNCHSVSLTGGEPLLNTEFLKEFLPECHLPIYLETNATLASELKEIINYVDYIAADIKLPSATGEAALWKEHEAFFEWASKKKLFAKIIFDSSITDDEIENSIKLAAKYGIEIILQPKCTPESVKPDMILAEKIFDKFLQKYKKVRFIPQVHKFLEVR